MDDTEGWQSFSFLDFPPPTFGNRTGEPGTLDMTANTNVNQVGIWQSPAFEIVAPGEPARDADAIPLMGTIGSTIFSSTYTVMTDEPDQVLVPQIRVRTTADNSQQSEVLSIESHYDGAFSPTVAGRDYTLLFRPSATSPIFRFQFDMLNFYPLDSATATVMLDYVTIQPMPSTLLDGATSERVYDFVGDQDGWNSFTMGSNFSEPAFAYDSANSRLGIEIADTGDFQFGFWGSTIDPANNVPIVADRLYGAVYSVGTNIADPDQVPEFRLRLNESLFRVSQYTNIASTGTADNVPTTDGPKDYMVFFPVNMGVGRELLCSFDLLTDPSADNVLVGGSIFVERVEVFSAPAP